MHKLPENLVNLKRYPILALDSPEGMSLIKSCQMALENDALCLLPKFLTANTVNRMAAEAGDLSRHAIPQNKLRTSYGWMDNSGFEPDHPRAQVHRVRNSTVTLNHIPQKSIMRQLFFWDALTEFVRRCLGFEKLYCCACPYLALEVKYYDTDEDICWHYDTNDGVVSLLLQEPDEGGGFEYVPYLRSEEDENYDEVRRVFDGSSDRIQRPVFKPGTLVLFRGRRSMHRVAPVGETARPRQILLLSYDEKPNMVFPDQTVQAVINPGMSVHSGTPSIQRSQY